MKLVWGECEDWWKGLLGQKADFTTFDKDKAKESIPYSDVDAAELIATRLKHRISYIAAFETWYVWDGRIHRPLQTEAPIIMLVKRFAREYRKALEFVDSWYETEAQAAEARGDTRGAEALRKDYKQGRFRQHRMYRDSLHSARSNRALVSQMRFEFDTDTDYFSQDQRWFVFENGVIDLEDVRKHGTIREILKHSPERRVTRYFKAKRLGDFDWDNLKDSTWVKFMESSVPDAEARVFLQKIVGCTFMAEPKLKVIPNLSGPRNSGKSLFISLLHRLSGGGSSYSDVPTPAALMKRDGTNFEQDKLRGRRFIGITEPNPHDQLDEGFVKAVSGGDYVQTRGLHKSSTGWYPQCVMFIASNDPVRFNTRDEALLQRVALIDFPNEFKSPTPEDPDPSYRLDPTLEDTIMAEGESVLLWVIQGMLLYLRDGLVQPESVKSNRHDTKYSSSASLRWVKEFIDEEYIIEIPEDDRDKYEKKDWLDAKFAWDAYLQWANESNERFKLNKSTFYADLDSAYGKRVMSDGARRIPGLIQTQKWKDASTGLSILGGKSFTF